MRVIQLCFRLHFRYCDAAEERYRLAEKEIYQPLFALIERNQQKTRNFHFTLMISGPWLEMTEKYAPNLIERLKKIITKGGVELVAEPYYYSLAIFYNEMEMAEQTKLYLEKVKSRFGVERRILALPELIYNDKIKKWAEEFGFAGMLAGDASRVLDWRSANHVYEAAGCQYLRVLFENVYLTQMIEHANAAILSEKRDEMGRMCQVLDFKKFEKYLDLEFLRGRLVNLYLDAELIMRQRQRGVIKFLDELIAAWTEAEDMKMANAAEACVAETPAAEVSVRQTISCLGDEVVALRGCLPIRLSDIEYQLPWWVNGVTQKQLGEKIYKLRRVMVASEDEKLMTDYRWLMQLDYQKGAVEWGMKVVSETIDRLYTEIEEVKKRQAVEISRAYTKKRDRGDIDTPKFVPADEETEIKINFGTKRTVGTESKDLHASDNDGVVPVRRLTRRPGVVPERKISVMTDSDEAIDVIEALQDAEEAEIILPEVEKKPKKLARDGAKHRMRRVIKKLVIE